MIQRPGFLAAVAIVVAVALPVAAADDVTVEARVDSDRIGEGDSVTLTIAIDGQSPGIVEEPDLSGLADFTVVAGPSVSTSTSMVWRGGQASSSTSRQYSYVLMPRRRGVLTIPTISVRIGKRIMRTDPISVEVVEGRLHGAPRSRPRSPDRTVGPGRGEIGGDVLVETEVDKRSVFVGEQVLITYKVYTQLELAELPSPQQLPSYTGFWVEEIPVDPRATIRRVRRDGKEYHQFVLMKKALFPTTSGRLEVEATAFGLPVKVRSRDPFESIFFTPTRLVYRQTAPVTIDVKPLPDKGRPESFNGAVGQYTMTVSPDRTQTRVNEAIGLKVSVEGTGNIRVVGEASLPPLPDFKTYEPKVDETRRTGAEPLAGSKVWDYVLTPLSPGSQEIPPIRFAYFDPERAEYVETASEPIPIEVARADPGAALPAGAQREVTAVGRDIRYIKPAAALLERGIPFHRSGVFVAVLVAPIVVNAGLFVMVRRREHRAANEGLLRKKRAPAFARRRLRAARDLLASGRSAEFHQEVYAALTGYLGDMLEAAPSGLTHDRIDGLLSFRGVDEKLRTRLIRCLEACDYARFAPSGAGRDALATTLEEAVGLIVDLDRYIGRDRRGSDS